ncbi:hypothetical protein Ahy_A03g011310 [Arachis hypogaea]|uniref:Ethylene-responsive binding factor-associated repression domain-containing protein n=1 Tax=Arachis hypogaea TaxID=3818 RepID=A0A445DQC1_ARAHY|nr:hypothetical protein Ahy_A03g011310 [Arachis hypogaea]
MNDFSRDMLKGFMSRNHHHHHELQQQQHHHGDGDAEQEIELGLGLSMNGRFGVNPTTKKIKRTTSIPEFSFSKSLIRDEDNNNKLKLIADPFSTCRPLCPSSFCRRESRRFAIPRRGSRRFAAPRRRRVSFLSLCFNPLRSQISVLSSQVSSSLIQAFNPLSHEVPAWNNVGN